MQRGFNFFIPILSSAFVLVAATTPSAHAQTVVNGSFESDDWSGGPNSGLQLDVDSTVVTGWTAVDAAPSSLFFIEGWNNANAWSTGPTPFGSQWLVLGDSGLGGNYVEQEVTGFTPGDRYEVEFSLSSEGNLGGANVGLSFQSGSATPGGTFTAPAAITQSWDTWRTYSYGFVPNAATITLRFEDLGSPGGVDAGLDNVSVRASRIETATVPEPGSFALLLAGLVPLLARSRKRTD